MRLGTKQIREMCADKGLNLCDLLETAGVSRTAYYSLARRENVIPKSVVRIAKALAVPVSRVIEDDEAQRAEMLRMAEEANDLAAKHRGTSSEDICHTLILLRHEPIERLRRALRRAP